MAVKFTVYVSLLLILVGGSEVWGWMVGAGLLGLAGLVVAWLRGFWHVLAHLIAQTIGSRRDL